MNTYPHALPTDPYSRYSSEVGDNDIGAIIKILQDRHHIIWIFVAIFVALSTVYVLKLQPHYSASAQIMLTSPDTPKRPNNIQSLLNTVLLDGSDLLSQIQIMQSPDVVEQLVVDQQLYRDPEFGGSKSIEDFYLLSKDHQRSFINRVRQKLSITALSGTSIVNVEFRSIDPIKAASIANAYIDVYAKTEQTKLDEQSHSALNWLVERLNDLKAEVFEAETALEKARAKNELGGSNAEDTRLERIEYLNKSLSKAQEDLAKTKSVLEAAEKAYKTDGRIDTIPSFIGDRLMENLKSIESGLVRKKAILEETYGPNHPQMIALRAEFLAFQAKVKEEMERYVETHRKRKYILEGQIDLIQKQINDYKASYQEDSGQRVKIRNLKTQAETARALLNSFTKSYMETLQSLNVDKHPIRVVSRATPPHISDMPQKTLIILLSGFSGFFLGVLIALILERVQNTIQTPRQLERLSGFPVYSLIPKIRLAKGQKIIDYLMDHATSPIAESVRSLFTSLQLRDPHTKEGARVVTMTSTYANEGKTTNAIWLATVAAQSGKKVLVIDGDMRRPSLHKMYGIGNAKGLTDYLSDRLPLDDVIYKNHASGVHLMTAKAVPTHALVLLASDRMTSMMRKLRDIYDLIIIDSPTSLIFSDARVLAKLSDKTLYIVEWKKTDRDDLKESLKHFADMDYNEMAVILNKIDPRKILHMSKKEMAYMNYLNMSFRKK